MTTPAGKRSLADSLEESYGGDSLLVRTVADALRTDADEVDRLRSILDDIWNHAATATQTAVPESLRPQFFHEIREMARPGGDRGHTWDRLALMEFERDAAIARAEKAEAESSRLAAELRRTDTITMDMHEACCDERGRQAQAEAERNRLIAELRLARKAIRAALAVWVPGGNPGGDGADGETWGLCQDALAEALS